MLNTNFLNKNYLPGFFRHQFIIFLLIYTFLVLLTYKKYPPIQIGLGLVIIFTYSYFIHIIFHNLPSSINIHLLFHHNKNIKINKYINILIETLTNILFFYIFYFLQKASKINFVPNIIIIYYGIIYITIHNINYSIFHLADNHILHHNSKNKACNFGPDLLDHVFNTSCNNKYENYDPIIINTLFAFLITYYLYKPTLF